VTDPVGDMAGSWLTGARDAARQMDGFVRTQPWAALAVVALVALAAGYSLSRRG
jgi:ElaB/YqjD/DUF883 family membrane-anchored ribosome-binding protein